MKICHCINVLSRGLAENAFPSAAVAVGRGREVYLREVMGHRTTSPDLVPADFDTLYDLASLTKLVATTMVTLKLLEEGRLLLTHTLGRYFTEDELKDAPEGRRNVTVFQLMTHTSGITPHIPLHLRLTDPEDAVKTILASPPVCPPGTQVYYSCMGYILLAKILERITGSSLDALARRRVFEPLGMTHTTYCPTSRNVAATEFSTLRGCYISGEVHDENAHFLGGVSGNAGVFSTLDDMSTFAMMLSERGRIPSGRFLAASTFDLAVRNFTPGLAECRGLGFQLKPPVPALSAMGDLMSEGSYGHTGFTGTSLYVDAQTGLWGVLLTNAVHFGRDKTAFLDLRRAFHNAMVGDFES
ncbi:MAG: beta-lactamase family protein [Ruminococcaceae bacterium]|nr:beta-lactamase family protein [Oscillospiraceae bacterium]